MSLDDFLAAAGIEETEEGAGAGAETEPQAEQEPEQTENPVEPDVQYEVGESDSEEEEEKKKKQPPQSIGKKRKKVAVAPSEVQAEEEAAAAQIAQVQRQLAQEAEEPATKAARVAGENEEAKGLASPLGKRRREDEEAEAKRQAERVILRKPEQTAPGSPPKRSKPSANEKPLAPEQKAAPVLLLPPPPPPPVTAVAETEQKQEAEAKAQARRAEEAKEETKRLLSRAKEILDKNDLSEFEWRQLIRELRKEFPPAVTQRNREALHQLLQAELERQAQQEEEKQQQEPGDVGGDVNEGPIAEPPVEPAAEQAQPLLLEYRPGSEREREGEAKQAVESAPPQPPFDETKRRMELIEEKFREETERLRAEADENARKAATIEKETIDRANKRIREANRALGIQRTKLAAYRKELERLRNEKQTKDSDEKQREIGRQVEELQRQLQQQEAEAKQLREEKQKSESEAEAKFRQELEECQKALERLRTEQKGQSGSPDERALHQRIGELEVEIRRRQQAQERAQEAAEDERTRLQNELQAARLELIESGRQIEELRNELKAKQADENKQERQQLDAIVGELKARLQQADTTAADLRSALTAKDEQYQQEQKQLRDDYEAEKKQQTEGNAKQQRETEEKYQAELKERDDRLAFLEGKHANLVNFQKTSAREQAEELAELRRQIEAQQAQSQPLPSPQPQQAVAAPAAAAAAPVDEKTEIERLRAEVSEKEKTIKQLKVDILEEERKTAQQEQQKRLQAIMYESQVAREKNQVTALNRELTRHTNQEADLTEKLRQARIRADEQAQQIEQAQQRRVFAERQLNELKQATSQAQEEFERKQAVFQQQQQQQEERARQGQQIAQAAQSLEEQFRAASGQNAQLQLRVSELERQLAIESARARQYAGQGQELARRGQEVTARLQQLEVFRTKATEKYRDCDRERQDLQEQLEKLQEELKAARDEIAELQQANRDKAARIAELEADVQRWQSDYKTLQDELAKVNQKNAELQQLLETKLEPDEDKSKPKYMDIDPVAFRFVEEIWGLLPQDKFGGFQSPKGPLGLFTWIQQQIRDNAALVQIVIETVVQTAEGLFKQTRLLYDTCKDLTYFARRRIQGLPAVISDETRNFVAVLDSKDGKDGKDGKDSKDSDKKTASTPSSPAWQYFKDLDPRNDKSIRNLYWDMRGWAQTSQTGAAFYTGRDRWKLAFASFEEISSHADKASTLYVDKTTQEAQKLIARAKAVANAGSSAYLFVAFLGVDLQSLSALQMICRDPELAADIVWFLIEHGVYRGTVPLSEQLTGMLLGGSMLQRAFVEELIYIHRNVLPGLKNKGKGERDDAVTRQAEKPRQTYCYDMIVAALMLRSTRRTEAGPEYAYTSRMMAVMSDTKKIHGDPKNLFWFRYTDEKMHGPFATLFARGQQLWDQIQTPEQQSQVSAWLIQLKEDLRKSDWFCTFVMTQLHHNEQFVLGLYYLSGILYDAESHNITLHRLMHNCMYGIGALLLFLLARGFAVKFQQADTESEVWRSMDRALAALFRGNQSNPFVSRVSEIVRIGVAELK